MAVFNAGQYKHRQYFYCLVADVKPTGVYIGDRLYIIDSGVHQIWNGSAWVEYFEPKLTV